MSETNLTSLEEKTNRIASLEKELEELKDKHRVYTPEEIEIFQKCFDCGILDINEAIGCSKAEYLAKAERALAARETRKQKSN